MNDQNVEIMTEIAKEVAKDAYQDAGRPIMKPTGELLGLVPRAVKAALSPLEKWILSKEYNVEETKKLLDEKLKNVSPELIGAPEPYIAVPAIQYISYCMDNAELRDMYANLLANSMNKVVKNGVHPGFVEIIKQLCPDEAKILKHFSKVYTIPTITLRRQNKKEEEFEVIRNFTNIGETVNCEQPYDINKYFDNLIRLGLVQSSGEMRSLSDESSYIPLKEHPLIKHYEQEIKNLVGEYNEPAITECYMEITDFGRSFCKICLSVSNNTDS